MTASDEIAFRLDMNNTLLVHDRIGIGFDHHLAKEFGEKSWNRYWKMFEGLRHGHYAIESLNISATLTIGHISELATVDLSVMMEATDAHIAVKEKQ